MELKRACGVLHSGYERTFHEVERVAFCGRVTEVLVLKRIFILLVPMLVLLGLANSIDKQVPHSPNYVASSLLRSILIGKLLFIGFKAPFEFLISPFKSLLPIYFRLFATK